MTRVLAGIMTSLDGYVGGPDDGRGRRPGDGGERLHHWVFGRRWTYEDEGSLGEPSGEDAGYLAELMEHVGAVVCGRWTYEAAEHWGGENRWNLPVMVVTHRPEEEPPGAGF